MLSNENRLKSSLLSTSSSTTSNKLLQSTSSQVINPLISSLKSTTNSNISTNLLQLTSLQITNPLTSSKLKSNSLSSKPLILANQSLLGSKKKIELDLNDTKNEIKRLKLNSNLSQPLILTKVTTTSHASSLKASSLLSTSRPLISLQTQIKDTKNDINVVKEAFKPIEQVQNEQMDYQGVPQIEYSSVIDMIQQNNDILMDTGNEDDNDLIEFYQPEEHRNREIENSDLLKVKNLLIDVVSSSLLRQPNFKNSKDPVRLQIIDLANRVIPHDSEFILKLALYTRCELNIRTTANFLLCLASFKNECRPYLSKYFNKSIQLPSDWIDVAEQYQSFFDERIKYGALPSALRKCMSEKFVDFDEYQLAKYNKTKKSGDNSKLENVKKIKGKSSKNNDEAKEDKYVLSIPANRKGLAEWIYADIELDLNPNEPLSTVKFDLIERKENPAKKRSNNVNTYIETIPLRVIIDYNIKKITKKAGSNGIWSNSDDTKIKTKKPFEKRFKLSLRYKNDTIEIYINDELISKHHHDKFGYAYALNQINFLRFSGNNFKMHEFRMPQNKTRNDDEDETEEETEKELEQKTFTLKQLIRQLHISKPVKPILCLLGKNYPLTFEEFIQTGLPGIFESEKAGKRMKLPVPETWETQISLKGNHAYVWQELIDHKKLPFMAMLRNLRNMIKAGISDKHHQFIIKKLETEETIINSKQFPFRFFSAYEVLDDLLKEYQEFIQNAGQPKPAADTFKRKNKIIKRNTVKEKIPKDFHYDENLINRYKKALDNSLKIATTYNISPIKGKSLIFVNFGHEMSGDCKTARLGKSARTIGDIAVLLGLMFKYSCEYSKLYFYSSLNTRFFECNLKPGTILDNMKSVDMFKDKACFYGDSVQNMQNLLEDAVNHRIQYDNIIILSKNLTANKQMIQFFDQFLKKYRTFVNRNLLFVNVDLGAKETKLLMDDPFFTHENDVSISGYSDSILRFVAEKGNQGQLTHIENIDKSYDLSSKHDKKDTKIETRKVDTVKSVSLLPSITPVTKTVRVFISSTFKDMHSERDILSKVVFPMLRAKLGSRFINVQEIDLRWGITEEEANSNKTLGICLNKIKEADLFVGLLGDRYGYIPSDYGVPNNRDFDWIKHSSTNEKSITQLEIEYSTIHKYSNRQQALERNFFYFRNSKFINEIKNENEKLNFISENEQASVKLKSLKERIKQGSFEVYDSYECDWLGVDKEGRCLLTKLDDFAQRVYNNLLNAINRLYPVSIENDAHDQQKAQHEACYESYLSSFIGRKKLLGKCDELIKAQMMNFNFKSNNPHILLIEGEPGSGKTSLACKLIEQLLESSHRIFYYMTGAYISSEYEIEFLKYFLTRANRTFNLNLDEELFVKLDEARKLFGDVLDKISEKVPDRYFVFIDSIDSFCDLNGKLDESLGFLPEKLPNKVTLIFTSRDTSSISRVLKKHQDNSKEKGLKFVLDRVSTTDLEVLEKSELIRARLELYNKSLDENGFNNQMKLLTGKKDARNPFYLSLVCEELKLHGHYETITQKLKEYPPKISPLINYVLIRLENDFGSEIVSNMFLMLALARDGLLEFELKMMLNLAMILSRKGINLNSFESISDIKKHITDLRELNIQATYLSDVKFVSVVESIKNTFIFQAFNSNILKLRSNPVMEGSIKNRYLKSDLIKSTHRLMALFYWLQIDSCLNFNWSNEFPRAFIYLPYHLTHSDCLYDLFNILSDLKFIALKCNLKQTSELMNDFSVDILVSGSRRKIAKTNQTVKFENFKKFFISNQHILSKNPTLVYQQALNDSTLDFGHLLHDNSIGLLFENLTKTNFSSINAPVIIKDFTESVTCVAISTNGQFVACGLDDSEIHVYNIQTANLIKRLQGHAGRINGLCYIGTDTLCSTSSDGLASLWSVSVGHRIRVLNKHNDHVVSGCAVDPVDGKHLLTTGWDCSIRIWSTGDGSYVGDIKSHGRPINCISFSPIGNIFATGCWDSSVRIFDLFNRTRKGILRGHSSSVRALCYSRDGTYIASAAVDGDVILWNAIFGVQIGVIREHCLPVNTLKYSLSSDALLTGSNDRKTKIWSGNMGKLLSSTKDDQQITCVTFNTLNSDHIALGYQLGDVKIFRLSSQTFIYSFKTHMNTVRRLKYSSDGTYLVSTGDDHKVALTYYLKNEITYLKGNQAPVGALAVSSYDTIVTGSEDAVIRVYRGNEEEISLSIFDDEEIPHKTQKEAELTLTQHTSPITAVSFKPGSNNRLVSVSKDATLITWNLTNGRALLTLNAIHSDWITDVAWSNVADYIVTSSNDQSLKIWNADTGKLRSTLVGHTSNINSCSFQYGCIVSTSSDGCIKIWSQKGHEITTLQGHSARVNACDVKIKTTESKIEFDEKGVGEDEIMEVDNWANEVDSQEVKDLMGQTKKESLEKESKRISQFLIASSSDDHTFKIWSLMESNLLATLEGHNDSIESIDMSKENTLCVASKDRTVKIWNLKDFLTPKQPVPIPSLKNHLNEVTCIIQYDKFVLTSSRDGLIYIWMFISKNQTLEFKREFEAHSKSCNKMLKIKETNDTLEFATCSDDGKCKIWSMTKENTQIDLIHKVDVPQKRPILFMEKYLNYLVIILTIKDQIQVEFYNLDNHPIKCTGTINLSGYATFLSDVHLSGNRLIFGLVNNSVLRLDIDRKHLTSKTTKSISDGKTVEFIERIEIKERTVWMTSISNEYAGDSKGNLHRFNGNEIQFVRKIHSSHVTCILPFKINRSQRLLTASNDGTVKIWTFDASKQIGQFDFNAGITNIYLAEAYKRSATFILADSMGSIQILKWYDR